MKEGRLHRFAIWVYLKKHSSSETDPAFEALVSHKSPNS